MKRKDSKDMLALREVVELEKRSFAEKLTTSGFLLLMF
jgi:hypothetical protein